MAGQNPQNNNTLLQRIATSLDGGAPVGGGGTTGGATEAKQDDQITALNEIKTQSDADKGAGVVTAKTTRITLDDEYRTAFLFANWTKVPGNSREVSYFAAGVSVRNPSGTAGNIDSVIYKQADGTVRLTESMTYDAADNVIKIQSA